MISKDWYKAMEEAGCPHMKYIKVVKEEVVRKTEGWAYKVVTVFLEKKYPSGLMMRSKVEVDVDLLKTAEQPELALCGELESFIKAMDKEAGIEYQAGPADK